jgi:hypothetical protein
MHTDIIVLDDDEDDAQSIAKAVLMNLLPLYRLAQGIFIPVELPHSGVVQRCYPCPVLGNHFIIKAPRRFQPS